MNKDIESLVGFRVAQIEYLSSTELAMATTSATAITISEPGMVIDSITGDLFGLVGRRVEAVRRRDTDRFAVYSKTKSVSYAISCEKEIGIWITFKEPSND